jgi:hypothetical protein
MAQATELPPLDGFTRAELEELVGTLHGALVRAQADYETLAATTDKAVGILKSLVGPAVPQ